MSAILSQPQCVNGGRLSCFNSSDVGFWLWGQYHACRSWCPGLTAPSHYLTQCWLISRVLWHSADGNCTKKCCTKSIIEILLTITHLKLQPHLPGADELMYILCVIFQLDHDPVPDAECLCVLCGCCIPGGVSLCGSHRWYIALERKGEKRNESMYTTVGCCYNMIHFLWILHNKHPIARLWGNLCSLTHWGQDKMADFSQAFSKPFSSVRIYEFRLIFHWCFFLMVKLTIFQYWFR